MSANGQQVAARQPAKDTVAGFLATFVHFVSPVAVFYYPGRIGPGAMLVALVAAGISTRPSRLVATAVGAATFWWFVGMVVSISLDRSLF